MYLKSFVMFFLFLGPIALVSFSVSSSLWFLFGCFIISGFGSAGIGMSVMHDAIHGTYSSNPTVNKFFNYALKMLGVNSNI